MKLTCLLVILDIVFIVIASLVTMLLNMVTHVILLPCFFSDYRRGHPLPKFGQIFLTHKDLNDNTNFGELIF